LTTISYFDVFVFLSVEN